MVIDDELVARCADVCESTGWGVEEQDSGLHRKWSRNGTGEWYQNISGPMVFKGQIPVYTSDYLLEKLPTEIKRYGRFELVPTMRNTRWSAGYFSHNRLEALSVVSDTPLKALLKLVVALVNEGVNYDLKAHVCLNNQGNTRTDRT